MSVLIFDELCQHADSPIGVPGNGWTDLSGSGWAFISQRLHCQGVPFHVFALSCVRPLGEVGQDQATVTYSSCTSLAAGTAGNIISPILRQSGTEPNFYGYVAY